MLEQDLEILRFPIGRFKRPDFISIELIRQWVSDIESFPSRLIKEVVGLSDAQLDTPYREKGWTIRQVVHHCADSHMNSLIRFKLTLTEDKPVVKPYWEDRWAELVDSKMMPIAPSLQMLEGIHARWIVLLKSLSEKDYSKSFIHPEHGKEFRVDENIGVYAWHCNHHLAHITQLKKRKNWK
jgi:DinB superfamily